MEAAADGAGRHPRLRSVRGPHGGGAGVRAPRQARSIVDRPGDLQQSLVALLRTGRPAARPGSEVRGGRPGVDAVPRPFQRAGSVGRRRPLSRPRRLGDLEDRARPRGFRHVRLQRLPAQGRPRRGLRRGGDAQPGRPRRGDRLAWHLLCGDGAAGDGRPVQEYVRGQAGGAAGRVVAGGQGRRGEGRHRRSDVRPARRGGRRPHHLAGDAAAGASGDVHAAGRPGAEAGGDARRPDAENR